MNSYSEFPYSILPSLECSSLAMYQMHKQIFFFKKKRNRCFDPLMDIWTRRLWSPGRLCFCLFVFSFLEVFFCFFELRRWFCAEECTCSIIIYWVSSNCQGRNWLTDRNTTVIKPDTASVLRDWKNINQRYWIDSHEVSPVFWKDRELRQSNRKECFWTVWSGMISLMREHLSRFAEAKWALEPCT